jgi:hypothetical protein
LKLSAVFLLGCRRCFATASAFAGSWQKPLMRNWKSEVARAEPMLSGAAPYDEAELRRVLGVLVADSQEIQSGVAGRSAQALGIKSRFSQLEADATATLGSLSARDAARTRFVRLRHECGARHDVFAN